MLSKFNLFRYMVASTEEWKALRGAAGMPPGTPGMEDDALAGNRLFLLGQESVKVGLYKLNSIYPELESAYP